MPLLPSIHFGVSGSVTATVRESHLDAETARALREHLRPLAGTRRLELDLGNVSFVNGGGLGQLAALHQEWPGLTLRNVAAALCELFELTRLDTLLDVRPAA